MFHALLIWAAIAGLVLSAIMVPNLIQNRTVKLWRRALYCIVLGPTVWTVLVVALIIAAIMFCVHCEKARRAKKAKN